MAGAHVSVGRGGDRDRAVGGKGGVDAQLPLTGQAQHKLQWRRGSRKDGGHPARGPRRAKASPSAWPWRVSFRTQGRRRPGSRDPASKVCSKGSNGTGPMRKGLISSVPRLETHTPSSSSPVFPYTQTLRPDRPSYCSSKEGQATAPLRTKTMVQHYPWGPWHTVFGEKP